MKLLIGYNQLEVKLYCTSISLSNDSYQNKKYDYDFKEASGDGFEVVNANSSREEISLGNQWSEDMIY